MKKKILIADDDEEICEVLADILREKGYLVRAVYDGHAAWELIQRELFDTVILDLKLPLVAGVEVLRRSRGLSRKVKIIVISGRPMRSMLKDPSTVLGHNPDPEEEEILRSSDVFLNKPFPIETLLEHVRRLSGRV